MEIASALMNAGYGRGEIEIVATNYFDTYFARWTEHSTSTTTSGCFGNALCASTGRFLYSGLVVVEQKCRIAKPVRKRNDFQVQI